MRNTSAPYVHTAIQYARISNPTRAYQQSHQRKRMGTYFQPRESTSAVYAHISSRVRKKSEGSNGNSLGQAQTIII